MAETKASRKSPKASPSIKKRKAYEAWTRGDLSERAKEIGIEGLSRSAKADIIHALRGR